MSSTTASFDAIYQRACDRKGGERNLTTLLSQPATPQALAEQPDSFYLANMSRCIFNAGFVWKIVTHKWPDFERVFLNFEPSILLRLSDEQWEKFSSDERIIRHHKKIQTIKHNAQYLHDLSFDYNGFGDFLTQWPTDDQFGLLFELKQRASRLGGMSGQYFLRRCGYDGYVLSKDVVLCLQDAGCDIANTPTAKRDFRVIQDT
ncbi:MAG: DNA-3-methyladenine glycosylase I, partial [Pseudomonadota bacterium]